MLLLEGLRVLDLGQFISGPCAAVLLSEMGAEVIKIEQPPNGDPFRSWDPEKQRLSPSFVAFNRGKQSVLLDLKSADGKEAFLSLSASADIVIENFRPGVMGRLGLGFETLRKSNGKLILCSISGFGSSGPNANLPAYDGVALGYSGLASLLIDEDNPRVMGPALADAITGHSAALAILAALIRRAKTNHGVHLEISMLGALAHFMSSAISKQVVDGLEEGPYTRPHGSVAQAFTTQDNRLLLFHLSSPSKFWEGLCASVDRVDLLTDPRFISHRDRSRNYDQLHEELAPIFSKRNRSDWLQILQSNEVPCAPVNRISEALADPQLLHLGIIDTQDEPGRGLMPRIRPPALVDGHPMDPVSRAPLLGEHTERVMSEINAGTQIA
mgnify:CR=1 FL=1